VLQFAAAAARASVVKLDSSRAIVTVLGPKLSMAVMDLRFNEQANNLDGLKVSMEEACSGLHCSIEARFRLPASDLCELRKVTKAASKMCESYFFICRR
jgi:hypothetical protein